MKVQLEKIDSSVDFQLYFELSSLHFGRVDSPKKVVVHVEFHSGYALAKCLEVDLKGFQVTHLVCKVTKIF